MEKIKYFLSNLHVQVYAKYFALALLILLPLFKRGYVLTFDMSWGPVLPKTSTDDNTWLFLHITTFLSYLMSSAIVQKFILFTVIILSFVGIHKLIDLKVNDLSEHTVVLGATLFVFNPFFYTRLMAGQWLVLCGYALLPWIVYSSYQFVRRNSIKNGLAVLAWLTAVGYTSSHVIAFSFLILATLFIFVKGYRSRKIFWYFIGIVGAWILFNAFWLISFLNHSSSIDNAINGFGASQLQAFASSGSVLGSVPLSTLLLQGFWADPQGRYYLPSHLGWWWGIVVILLGGLIVAGAVKVIQRRDRLGMSLLILAVIAWWLGMGVGSSWSAGTAHWLVAHVPLYRGYREPQKWLMLLALTYAYLLAIGTSQVAGWLKNHRPTLETPAVYAVMLLPILLVPMLLWGAGGQLRSSRYPADWSQTAAILNKDKSDYQVLVLPWHIYLPVSFVGRVVANPAPHYFKQDLIISDNLELAGVPPTQTSPLYKQIDNYLLPQAPYRSDAAKQLAPYHVKYVILLHEADWQKYGWLPKQTDLKPLQRSDHISLYRNTEVR